jgi:hypothetical protein
LGAKTALLAYAAEDPVESLRRARQPDPAATRALVAATHPGSTGTGSSSSNLFDGCYPEQGTVYAGSFPGIEILCDLDVMDHLPSAFPARYLDVAAGRRVILHAMHSVADMFTYAVWENGTLVRSLALTPQDGIIENIGAPLPFETPYWAGEHPVRGRYPLPFHPLSNSAAARHCGRFSASSSRTGRSLRISTRNRSSSSAFRFRQRTP